jgi:hypothetical protein
MACIMKKPFVLTAMSLIMVMSTAGLDIKLEGLIGNIQFPRNSDSPVQTRFQADSWLYGTRITLSERIGETFRMEISYENDPILRHIMRSLITYQSGYLTASAGPIMGIFNGQASPIKAGIGTMLRVDLPGLVFAALRAESSLGTGLSTTGDYSQSLGELSVGWYARNAICYGTFQTRSLHRVIGDGQFLHDMSNRFAFSVDAHRKGAPYRMLVTMGYEEIQRAYPVVANPDTLGLVFLGGRLTADISAALSIAAGLESAVYAFGMDALASPDPQSFLVRGSLGVVIRFGMLQ